MTNKAHEAPDHHSLVICRDIITASEKVADNICKMNPL